MVGLDTLNMWLSVEKVGSVNLLDTVPRFLDSGTVTYQVRDNGRASIIGHIDNYRITIHESGVRLEGSLPKNHLGNNVQSLNPNETALAVQSLSDRTHLPLERAKVGRFDFAHTFVVKRPVEHYLEHLGNSEYYSRNEQTESITWKGGTRQKTVYDKRAESKRRKSLIPDDYQKKHLLRYELRYVSDLPKQFNTTEVTPKLLCNEDFCRSVVNQWVEEYKGITKIRKMTFSSTPASPNEFIDQLTIAGIESMGGHRAVEDLVNQIRSDGGFTLSEHPSRIKRRVKALMQHPSLTVPSELITELDEKVLAVGRLY